MFKYLRKNKKGFTLIELIVVVAILAILAAIAVPMIIGYADEARTAALQANAKMIAQSLNTANALAGTDTEPANLAAAKTLAGNLWPGGMTADEERDAYSVLAWTGGSAYVDPALVAAFEPGGGGGGSEEE